MRGHHALLVVLALTQVQGGAANIDLVATCEATSFYECGKQVGTQMRSVIHQSMGQFSDLTAWATGTEKGKDILARFVEVNARAYPKIMEEYRGLADGAQVTFERMLVAALGTELQAFAPGGAARYRLGKSCSDFHVMEGAGMRAWAHNEDETPPELRLSYLVRANVTNATESSVWVGFAYAPNVVGWAWGVNQHGMGQSINALFPGNVSIGLGTAFVSRDVLEARDLDDAVARATVSGHSAGQHFNLGNVHEADRQVMVECSPGVHDVRSLRFSAAEHKPQMAWHANLYESEALRGSDGGGEAHPSSAHRMARMQALAPQVLASCRAAPTPNATLLKTSVLDDRHDPSWPIHRNAHAPDDCQTLNSVVFDVVRQRVHVFGQARGLGPAPRTTVDWATLRVERG